MNEKGEQIAPRRQFFSSQSSRVSKQNIFTFPDEWFSGADKTFYLSTLKYGK